MQVTSPPATEPPLVDPPKWSHYWRKGGPIMLAKVSKWSHVAGERHAGQGPGVRKSVAKLADLEPTIARPRSRLAGDTPDAATRLVLLYDPGARPIKRAGSVNRSSSALSPGDR